MTDNAKSEYASYTRKVWVIYAILAICLIIFLVAVVARDNEEMFFYTVMTAAAAYVFRPTDRVIGKAVKRLFGVVPPEESDR